MKKRVSNKEKREILICGLAIFLTIITTIIVMIVGSNKNKDKTINVSSIPIDNNITQDTRTQEEILLINVTKKEEVLDAPEKAEEIKEEQNSNTEKSSKTGYYIMVNSTANVVTVYSIGEDGNKTPIKAMICSTGTATPSSGVYSVKNKRTWGYLFGDVWGHYTTNIVGNILFHSVPYLSNSPDTLEYWEYDKLGTSASMGCVRLTVADAKWIFDNMPYGTPVEFYQDSNPGPLGKPAAMKISGNIQCRDWDPTDPDSDNPWRNYTQEEQETISNNTITQQQAQPEQTVQPTQTQQSTPKPQENNQNNNQQQNNSNQSQSENKKETAQTENKQTDTTQTENSQTGHNQNNQTGNNQSEENNNSQTNNNNENATNTEQEEMP